MVVDVTETFRRRGKNLVKFCCRHTAAGKLDVLGVMATAVALSTPMEAQTNAWTHLWQQKIGPSLIYDMVGIPHTRFVFQDWLHNSLVDAIQTLWTRNVEDAVETIK